MAESEKHKVLKQLALYWLKEKCHDLIANEVDFYYKRKNLIADAVGIDLKKKEIRTIEVKVSKQDLKRDINLFNDYSYTNFCHYSYILCPQNIIQKDEIPEKYGLLWIDEYNKIKVIKNPIKSEKLNIKYETTLRRTCKAISNSYLFKFLRLENCNYPIR